MSLQDEAGACGGEDDDSVASRADQPDGATAQSREEGQRVVGEASLRPLETLDALHGVKENDGHEADGQISVSRH